MSIGSIGSSLSSIQDRFQSFQSGKTNITKDDLKELQSKLKSSGKDSPRGFEELSKDFDKIDKNGDGINVSELATYAKTQGFSIPSSGFPGGGKPPEMTKEDLVAMQSKMAQLGGQAPKGMDELIANFDKYAGDDGKLSADEFKGFADENGIEMPAGGPPPPPPSGGAETSGSSDLSSKFLDQLLGSSEEDDKKKKDKESDNSDKSGTESLSSALKKLVSGRYAQSSSNNALDLTQLLTKNVTA